MIDPEICQAFIVDSVGDDVRFYSKFGFALIPPANERAMYLLTKDAEVTVRRTDDELPRST